MAIVNCIVTREYIVVTYSGSPNFRPSGVTGPASFELTITGSSIPGHSYLTNAGISFYPAIPATMITKLPTDSKRTRGNSFTLNVTDESNAAIGTFKGLITEGKPEAIASIFNQSMSAASTVANTIAPPPAPGSPQATVTGAITGATNAINAPTFPILTEEIGYPPSPLAWPTGGAGGAPGTAPLGQVVTQALNSVLGWKVKTDDPKGFVGALNASFTCKEIEGHTECTWQPRSIVVQTDVGGGITGAQASIYARAKDALDQSLPLLDGLYALDPGADPEDVTAFREVVRTQLTQLVNEFGYLGGPRVFRVNTYFTLVLGPSFTPPSPSTTGTVQPNSDKIQGSLGDLRQLYGLYTVNATTTRTGVPPGPNPFINSVEDEQDTTNFRVLADYVTSLAQSWMNNFQFFGLNTKTPFFGNQLVLISRQLSVVAEDVDEVRFAMDSVFIGPEERQALQVNFGGTTLMFFEDFANWVQSFVSEEAPLLLQEGGIYAMSNTLLPVVTQLQQFAAGCQDVNNPGPPPPNAGLPAGFHTGRVQQSLQQLAEDLLDLQNRLKVWDGTVMRA